MSLLLLGYSVAMMLFSKAYIVGIVIGFVGTLFGSALLEEAKEDTDDYLDIR